MTISAQRGGENMSDKTYNGKIKSVETVKYGFKRSAEFFINFGIGDAIINWKKTPKGVQFRKVQIFR